MDKFDYFLQAAGALTADGARALAERYWHEDVVFEEPGSLPDSGVFEGREAARRRLEERLSIGGGRVVVDATYDAGPDRVLAELTVTIEPAGGGTELTFPWFQLATVRDGRVIHIREFTDRTEAFEAAGVSG